MAWTPSGCTASTRARPPPFTDGRSSPPLPGRDNLEHGLQFRPSLDEALAYLPPEDALSAFERADPIALSRRVNLVSYLADPTSPSYTIHELADLLDAFGRHPQRNRDPLVRAGYSRTGFERSLRADKYRLARWPLRF